MVETRWEKGVAAFGAAALLGMAGLTAVWAQQTAAPAAAAAAAVAQKPGTIHGTVRGRVTLPDGKPAVGFTVKAKIADLIAPDDWSTRWAKTVTDADGRYVLTLDPQNVYFGGGSRRNSRSYLTIVTDCTPYLTPTERPLDLKTDGVNRLENIDFALVLGPEITVRVRDADTREPEPGLTVKYGPAMNGARAVAGTTDAAGEIRFRSWSLDTRLQIEVPEARRQTVVPAPGQSFTGRITLASSADAAWNVRTYRMDGDAQSRPMPITGVLLGPNSRPVAGARVRIREEETFVTPAVRSGADGRFTIRTSRMAFYDPKRPPWTVVVSAGDLGARYQPTPEESWDGMTIPLGARRPVSIAGSVVDPAGRPRKNVPVWLSSRDGLTARTDRSGRFVFDDLDPEDTYGLLIGGADGLGWARVPSLSAEGVWSGPPLRLAPGERKDLGRIVLPSADKTIAGTVLDEHGKPFPGILSVSVQGEHTGRSVHTDAQGRFRLTGIVDEPLVLTAVFPTDPDPMNPHGFAWGPNSPSLAKRLPVKAGQEDIAIRVPLAAYFAARATAAPVPSSPDPSSLRAVSAGGSAGDTVR